MTIFVIDCPTPQRAPTLDRLSRMGVDIRVLYRYAETERGWGHVELDHPHEWLPASSMRAASTVVRRCFERRTQVVCAFGYVPAPHLAAILASRVRRIPLVMRGDSNVSDDEARSDMFKTIKGRLLRALAGEAHIWTIGSQNERYWASYGFRSLERIPYTVPVPPIGTASDGRRLRTALGVAPDAHMHLFVGRLKPDKGVVDLLQALELLPADGGSVLVVAGRGPDELAVRRAAARDRRLLFVGAVPNNQLGPYYAAANSVVVPSRREPWGLVVNEALANGCRVIASDRVGAAHDLLDSTSGVIVPSGDPARLASAMASEAAVGDASGPVAPIVEADVACLMRESLSRLQSERTVAG